MIIAILSVLVLTMFVWVLNKKLPLQICPICAGVTLTWMWMLLSMALGYLPSEQYEFTIAVLMGASIGGIVTELKKLFLKWRSIPNDKIVEKINKQLDDCC